MEKYSLKFKAYPEGTEKIYTEEELKAYYVKSTEDSDEKEYIKWKEKGIAEGFLKRH